MTRTAPAVVLAVYVAVGVTVAADPKAVTFAKADLGKVPSRWKATQTDKGVSVWKVVEDKTSPSKSGFALVQTSDDRDQRPRGLRLKINGNSLPAVQSLRRFTVILTSRRAAPSREWIPHIGVAGGRCDLTRVGFGWLTRNRCG